MKIPEPIDFRTLEERMQHSMEKARTANPPDSSVMIGFNGDTGEILLKLEDRRYTMPASAAEWIAGCLLDTIQAARKATEV